MANTGARAYMGVWGLCPLWGPGAKPLVRGSGAKPSEAEAYITIAGVNFCLKITGYPGFQKLGGTGPAVPMVVAPIPSHLGLHGAKPQLQTHFYDCKAYALEAIRFLKF
jgi:hypothetical protein